MGGLKQTAEIPPLPLESIDIPVKQYTAEPFAMLIFGGAGDLSQKMLMPALFHLYLDQELPEDFFIAGAGLPAMTSEEYRDRMTQALTRGEERLDREKWRRFRERLYYISGDFRDDETYRNMHSTATELGRQCGNNIIYYLAVAPVFTEQIIEKLKQHNLCRGGPFNTKLMLEKPFGRDRNSAAELNDVLTSAFNEEQIYRIDHFLGKETVQNIIFFRFANNIFEGIWNNHFVDNIQITVAEQGGIGKRGFFYEQTGVVRDMVQNHCMQLIATIAMEPPVAFEADSIRDEKVKIFRSIKTPDTDYVDRYCVRGQYGSGHAGGGEAAGYRQEENVESKSVTPTFFAGKFIIGNWRWAGVPFYVRTGKRMAEQLTQIIIQFKQPPLKLFSSSCNPLEEPNMLILTIQPDERISLCFGVKYPFSENQIQPVNLEFSYKDAFHEKSHPVYERLLLDSMKGDPTLFVRQDGVLAMWDVVDPINSRWEEIKPADFPNYAAGTWGPPEAGRLLEQDGRRWLSV